jgi:hypothetical protein
MILFALNKNMYVSDKTVNFSLGQNPEYLNKSTGQPFI